jgi:hypothetical protein
MISLLLPRRQLTLDPLRTYFLKAKSQQFRLINLEKKRFFRVLFDSFWRVFVHTQLVMGMHNVSLKFFYVLRD